MKKFNKRFKALTLSALLIAVFSFAIVPHGPGDPEPVPMSVDVEVGIDLSESN